jgi:hypothetical protein
VHILERRLAWGAIGQCFSNQAMCWTLCVKQAKSTSSLRVEDTAHIRSTVIMYSEISDISAAHWRHDLRPLALRPKGRGVEQAYVVVVWY